MPDFWETMKGLNPNNPDDRNDTLPDGYTRLEEYLNSIPVANPLPLNITSFIAERKNDNNIKLKWTVENGNGFQNFIIEKSIDGVSFKSVASIVSANQLQYDFIDIGVHQNVYYKIRAIDKTGKITYSSVLYVIASIKGETFNVYPNPLQSGSSVNIKSSVSERVVMSICDISGKILWEQNVSVIAGSNIIALPYHTLPKGMLLLTVKGNATNEKLMLQR
jgi:hypothetical protein